MGAVFLDADTGRVDFIVDISTQVTAPIKYNNFSPFVCEKSSQGRSRQPGAYDQIVGGDHRVESARVLQGLRGVRADGLKRLIVQAFDIHGTIECVADSSPGHRLSAAGVQDCQRIDRQCAGDREK